MVKQTSSKKSKQTHKSTSTVKKAKKTGLKRQPSAYLIFCAEQRIERKAEFDKLKPKEIMQHLGAEWRKLSPQQHDAYQTKVPAKSQHDASKSQKKTKRGIKHKSNKKGPAKKAAHREASANPSE